MIAAPPPSLRRDPQAGWFVELLWWRIDEHGFAGGDLLFRTRNDRRPGPDELVAGRCIGACRKVGHRPMRVYGCRNATATWLRADGPAR